MSARDLNVLAAIHGLQDRGFIIVSPVEQRAGYRILGPGELDAETVERALQVAEAFDGKPCGPAQLWNEEQRQFFDAGQLDASSSIAAGIRALKSGGNNART